jgi:CheY-like chemotaxis protein
MQSNGMTDILVIDDDEQVRRVIVRILAAAGHVVREAADGRAGLRLFRAMRPRLVITDLVMPEQEGIETIRTMSREAPEIPILAISGAAGPLYLPMATSLGATATLAKPFGADELLAIVAGLLSGEAPP